VALLSPLPTQVYGLVIGISKYQHPKYDDLQAAASDAEAVYTFLTEALNVPRENIIKLIDEAATRDGIIDSFRRLVEDPKFLKNQAFIIYYAGHGSRVAKPVHKDWIDWECHQSKVEIICPTDIKPVPEGTDVPGIPDRTIAALVNRLSSAKGNNIVSTFLIASEVNLSPFPFFNRLSFWTAVLRRAPLALILIC
jgi:hypothetical protein